jgi:hypothetical protein
MAALEFAKGVMPTLKLVPEDQIIGGYWPLKLYEVFIVKVVTLY